MRRALVPALIASALVLAALAAPAARAAPVSMPFTATISAVVDGAVVQGEYPGSFTEPRTGIEVHWGQNGTVMAVGVVSPGLGWLSIGFGPEGTIMDGVNILIGYVTSSATVFEDEFGVGFDHREDTALGGQDNLLARAGGESGGKTTLEFLFPLDSGDAYDVALQPGRPYAVTLAYHGTADDFVTLHDFASAMELTIEQDPSQVPTKVPTLTLGYAGDARQGAPVVLRAMLLGDGLAPISLAPVDFYLNSSVGVGVLGTAMTNATGIAELNYTFLSAGEFEFLARFVGDTEYLPGWANATIVAAYSEEPTALATGELTVRLIVFVALVGVLLAYLYSLLQVMRVRRIGSFPRGRATVAGASRDDRKLE